MGDYKPDFKRIYTIANEVLVSSNTIMDFPFGIKNYIKNETDISLCTFKKAFQKCGGITLMLGSEDAVLTEKNGMYVIYYNDQVNKKRKKWSLTHELGHFYAGHDLKAAETNRELYDMQEIESNFFAAQFLMPDQLIVEQMKRGCDITNYFLQNTFGVSQMAAEKRICTMRKTRGYQEYYYDNDYNEAIRLKFNSFLDRTAPNKKSYSFYLEEEEENQKERDRWLGERKREPRY